MERGRAPREGCRPRGQCRPGMVNKYPGARLRNPGGRWHGACGSSRMRDDEAPARRRGVAVGPPALPLRSPQTRRAHASRDRRRRRGDAAAGPPRAAGVAARAGDVCGRRRGAADHRPGAWLTPRGGGVPGQRRPVRLRPRDPDPVGGMSGCRHSPAGDDGRDLRGGRADAVDGGHARDRATGHLRLGDRRRPLRIPGRALRQPPPAAVSAGRHRHHHPGHRHLAHAGRHQLGRRRPADADEGHRRRARRLAEPELRAARRPRHRPPGAADDLGVDPLGPGLPRQRRGAAGHRRGLGARGLPRPDASRQGRGGALVRRRPAVPFRLAGIPSGADRHDVRGDDRRDDRIDRDVPGAGRDHRPAGVADGSRPRPAGRWARHALGRRLQHLPVYFVLAECRPRRGDRGALALHHGGRRGDHAGARPVAEDGRPGRGGAAGGARRSGPRDVRHGGGHRRAHPHGGRFPGPAEEPVRGGDRSRLGHDPAGGPDLLPQPAARAAPAARIGHPARLDRRGRAQRLLQRPREHRAGGTLPPRRPPPNTFDPRSFPTRNR